MLACTVITVIGAAVIGITNMILVNTYTNREKTVTAVNSAELLNYAILSIAENFPGQESEYVQRILDQMSEHINSHVLVVRKNGTIYKTSESARDFPLYMEMGSFREVLVNGNSILITGIFDSILNCKTSTVAIPFHDRFGISGSIMIVTEQKFLNEKTVAILYMMVIAISISILISLLLSYFLSRQLTKPLKKISKAASDIAHGHFTQLESKTNVAEYQGLVTAFNAMSADLEKQDKARSAFIANVSHDLRTPITTISGFVQGVMDGTIPPEQQNNYLEIVLREAKRMSEMVNSFIDLSRYESDKMQLHLADFDLIKLIKDVVRSMERAIQDKNLSIQFQYGQPQNIVTADETAIHRVVQNLLDNAVKFSPKHAPITISVMHDYYTVYVSITNHGPEISAEDQRLIWDRFYKTDQSRSVDKKGAGLGLFIVKTIINQHNQEITLQSKDGVTTFTFTLKASKN